MLNALRIEPHYVPRFTCTAIQDAGVEAIVAFLPEFKALRHEPETRPKGRPGDVYALELLGDFSDAEGEVFFLRHPFGLFGCPGADLARARAAGEIIVCFLLGDRFYVPFHPYLPAECRPIETERRL